VIQRFPNNASGDGSELDACLLVVVVVARLLVVLVIGSLGLDLLLMPREKEEQGGDAEEEEGGKTTKEAVKHGSSNRPSARRGGGRPLACLFVYVVVSWWISFLGRQMLSIKAGLPFFCRCLWLPFCLSVHILFFVKGITTK
jgi:hypothetical protein